VEDILRNFARQLSWVPKINREERLVRAPRVILCGMGGSRLAGDLARSALPGRDIRIHADFGFPPIVGNDTLFIASSCSGETEETLDAFRAILKQRAHAAIISAGGTLLRDAQTHDIPAIEIPAHNLPPRLAVGYSVRALLALMGDEASLAKTALAAIPDASGEGKALADRIHGSTPLIYASRRMGGLAYYWKVVLNETAKMPAFANVFPEAGHNELEGFARGGVRATCITLADPEDDARTKRRFDVFARICREREVPNVTLTLTGTSVWERIFRSVSLANWTAYHLALLRGEDPSRTALIETWKTELRDDSRR